MPRLISERLHIIKIIRNDLLNRNLKEPGDLDTPGENLSKITTTPAATATSKAINALVTTNIINRLGSGKKRKTRCNAPITKTKMIRSDSGNLLLLALTILFGVGSVIQRPSQNTTLKIQHLSETL